MHRAVTIWYSAAAGGGVFAANSNSGASSLPSWKMIVDRWAALSFSFMLQALELGHVRLQTAVDPQAVVEAVEEGHGRLDRPGRARCAEELVRKEVAAFADERRLGQAKVLEGLVELLALHLLAPF